MTWVVSVPMDENKLCSLLILYTPVPQHPGIYRGETPNFIKSVIKNRKYVKKMKKNKNFYPRISILGARCEIILG